VLLAIRGSAKAIAKHSFCAPADRK
jgi:hypothetical protein